MNASLVPNRSTVVTPSDTNYITAPFMNLVDEVAVECAAVVVAADTLTALKKLATNDKLMITDAGTTNLGLIEPYFAIISAAVVTTSVDLVTEIITKVDHGFVDDEPVYITDAGTTNLSLTTTYYINYIDADTFTLALTPDGAAVNIGGTDDTAPTIQSYVFQISAAYGSSAVNIGGTDVTPPTFQRIAIPKIQRVNGTLWIGALPGSGPKAITYLPTGNFDTNNATPQPGGAVTKIIVNAGSFLYDVKKVFATGTTVSELTCDYLWGN